MFYVYIISNNFRNVLYIGVTRNIERRLYEHKNKLIDGFSKKYNLINEILVKAYHKGAFSLEIRMACLNDHKNIIKSIEENNISKTLDSVKKHYLIADKIFPFTSSDSFNFDL